MTLGIVGNEGSKFTPETEALAREAMRLGAFKLPFPCRFVTRARRQ